MCPCVPIGEAATGRTGRQDPLWTPMLRGATSDFHHQPPAEGIAGGNREETNRNYCHAWIQKHVHSMAGHQSTYPPRAVGQVEGALWASGKHSTGGFWCEGLRSGF